MFSVTSGENAPPDAPPEFAYWQFGGIGVCQLVAGVHNARRIVMLERFTVDGFVHAIKTHGIKRSGVQPAVIRMLLDADVPKEDLASLRFPDQRVGSAGPRDPRRVRGAVRNPGPVGLRCNRIRGLTVRVDTRPDIESSVTPNATASAGRCPTPNCASSTRTPAPSCPRASRGCWRRRSRRSARTGSAPPTSPRSTPTGSSPCTAGPTARSTAAASRSCRKPFGGC